MVSPYFLENFFKYEFFFFTVPLYIEILFSTMEHAPTHWLSGILPKVSIPLLV